MSYMGNSIKWIIKLENLLVTMGYTRGIERVAIQEKETAAIAIQEKETAAIAIQSKEYW